MDTTASEPFQYRPLQPREIRSFSLDLSPTGNEAISGSIWHASLRNARYEALSYAWGPTFDDGSHLSRRIWCAAEFGLYKALDITESLYQALVRLQGAESHHLPSWQFEDRGAHVRRAALRPSMIGERQQVLPLWIDAICINQGDVGERNSQVAQMSIIYRQAIWVTVWLGEPASGQLGRDQESLVAPNPHVQSWRTSSEGHTKSFAVKFTFRVPWPPKDEAQLFSYDEEAAIVKSILQLPRFHRRWVIQEIADSNHVYIRLGKAEGSYSGLYELVRKHDLALSAGPLLSRLRPMTILQNLWYHDRSECSVDHDRVYALIHVGMDSWKVVVNYRKSLRDAYMDVALEVCFRKPEAWEAIVPLPRYRVSTERSRLLVLATCKRFDRSTDVDQDWESWLPDWRAPMKFDSELHKSALELCFARDFSPRAEHCQLPDSIHGGSRGDLSGHRYLHVPCESSRPHPECAFGLSLHEESSGVFRRGGKIWVPCMQEDHRKFSFGVAFEGIGFTLAAGQTCSVLRGRPVYRVQSCFRWHLEVRDCRHEASYWIGCIFSRLKEVVREEFYLE